MKQQIVALSILMFCASSAHADMYKCVVNGQTNYSDHPCGDQAVLMKDHGASLRPSAPKAVSNSMYSDAIRSRVIDAINEGDLVRASALAETPEQKGWVRDAERQAAIDAAGKRAEIDRKRQIQATLDATAAADRRAKRPMECETDSFQVSAQLSSGHMTCRQ